MVTLLVHDLTQCQLMCPHCGVSLAVFPLSGTDAYLLSGWNFRFQGLPLLKGRCMSKEYMEHIYQFCFGL